MAKKSLRDIALKRIEKQARKRAERLDAAIALEERLLLAKFPANRPQVLARVFRSQLDGYLARGWDIAEYNPVSYGAPEHYVVTIKRSTLALRHEEVKA